MTIIYDDPDVAYDDPGIAFDGGASGDVYGGFGRTYGSGSYGFPTIEDETGPRYGVEVDLTDADPYSPITWHDFSDRVLELDTNRGSSSPETRILRPACEPGTATIVLDDTAQPSEFVALSGGATTGALTSCIHIDITIAFTPTSLTAAQVLWTADGLGADASLVVDAGGTLTLSHSESVPFTTAGTLADFGFMVGQRAWLRVTATPAPGSTRWLTSSEGQSWTLQQEQSGMAFTFLTTPEIGLGDGLVHFFEQRSSVDGTVIVRADFADATVGTAPWTDGSGVTWTPTPVTGAFIAGVEDRSRQLDPANPNGPWYGALDEKRPVRVYWVADGHSYPVLHGYTDPGGWQPSTAGFDGHEVTILASEIGRHLANDAAAVPASGWEVGMTDVREPYDGSADPQAGLLWWHRFGRPREEDEDGHYLLRDSGPNGFDAVSSGGSDGGPFDPLFFYEFEEPPLVVGSTDPATRIWPGQESLDLLGNGRAFMSPGARLAVQPCSLTVSFAKHDVDIIDVYRQPGLAITVGSTIVVTASGPGWGPTTLTHTPDGGTINASFHVMVGLADDLLSLWVHDGQAMHEYSAAVPAGAEYHATVTGTTSSPSFGPDYRGALPAGSLRRLTLDEAAGYALAPRRELLTAKALGRYHRPETTETRARRLWDIAHIPQGLLDTDDNGGGWRTVTANELGAPILTGLQALADLERTRLFTARTGITKLRTSAVVPGAATNVIGDGPGETHCSPPVPVQTEAFGVVRVTNPNRVTPFEATDPAAAQRYPGKVLAVTLPAASQADADDLLDDVKIPRTLVPSIELDPLDDDARAEIAILDLEDTLTLKHRPEGGGYTLTQPSRVLAIGHRMDRERRMTVMYALDPDD